MDVSDLNDISISENQVYSEPSSTSSENLLSPDQNNPIDFDGDVLTPAGHIAGSRLPVCDIPNVRDRVRIVSGDGEENEFIIISRGGKLSGSARNKTYLNVNKQSRSGPARGTLKDLRVIQTN